MDKYGYDRRLSTGIVAIVGTLGCIIPPSVVLILYGLITEQSIGRLFLAGIIPGAIIAIFFVSIIYIWAKINPKLAPLSEKSSWKKRAESLPEVGWILIVFVLIIGGIMNGFPPQEEEGPFAVYSCQYKRSLNLKLSES